MSLIRSLPELHNAVIISSGKSLQFAHSQLPGHRVLELDTFKSADFALKRLSEHVPPTALIVTNTNPFFAAAALDAGYQVGLVDTLAWMWPQLPASLQNLSFHIVQAALPGVATGQKFQMPRSAVTRPFIREDLWTSQRPSRLGVALIGLGGMSLPVDPSVPAAYATWVARRLVPQLLADDRVQRIEVAGGHPRLGELITAELGADPRVEVLGALPQDEYAMRLLSAEFQILTPGLTTIYEMAHARTTPCYLPGYNLSQLLQAHHLRHLAGYPMVMEWPGTSQWIATLSAQPLLRAEESALDLTRRGLQNSQESPFADQVGAYLGHPTPHMPMALAGPDLPSVADALRAELRRALRHPVSPQRRRPEPTTGTGYSTVRRWTETSARAAADEACQTLGISSARMRLVRFGNNAMYALPVSRTHPIWSSRWHGTNRSGVVGVRVARPSRGRQSVETEHQATTAMVAAGAPVVPPLESELAWTSDGTAVGFCEWVPQVRIPLDMKEMGRALRRFHETQVQLPGRPLDPVTRLTDHAKRLNAIAQRGSHPLARFPHLIAEYWIESDRAGRDAKDLLADPRYQGPTHGDWSPGNTKRHPKRGVLGIDLEYTAHGPQLFDFAPLGLAVRRYGWDSSYYDAMAAGYGPDAPTLEEITPLIRLRELAYIAHCMELADVSPAYYAEFLKRTPALADPDRETPRWVHVNDSAAMRPAGVRTPTAQLETAL
jgi:hypothetical protein